MSGDTEKNQFIFINFLFYNINLLLVKFVFTYNRTTFLPRYINLKSFQKHWKPQSVLSLCHSMNVSASHHSGASCTCMMDLSFFFITRKREGNHRTMVIFSRNWDWLVIGDFLIDNWRSYCKCDRIIRIEWKILSRHVEYLKLI